MRYDEHRNYWYVSGMYMESLFISILPPFPLPYLDFFLLSLFRRASRSFSMFSLFASLSIWVFLAITCNFPSPSLALSLTLSPFVESINLKKPRKLADRNHRITLLEPRRFPIPSVTLLYIYLYCCCCCWCCWCCCCETNSGIFIISSHAVLYCHWSPLGLSYFSQF